VPNPKSSQLEACKWPHNLKLGHALTDHPILYFSPSGFSFPDVPSAHYISPVAFVHVYSFLHALSKTNISWVKCSLFTLKCHTVVLPFTLKSILRQKKNYGNSHISPYKNKIFKKSFKRNLDPSSYNSITNLKFHHEPKYHLKKSSYKSKLIT
jgi:hypothetical protein